jgi:DNA-binding NtrC family response regulator
LLAANLREAREFLGGAPRNLALLDLELPDGRGLELLPALSRSRTTEIVFISGHATVSSAVHALKEGASDFLEKPVELRRLRSILRRVRALQLPEFEPAVVRERIATEGRLGALVGRSPQMLAVYEQILKVGPTSATVMISGATGTGKELVAQTLHEMSSRAGGPLVAVNCGAFAPTLVESELFGHERGAFTGADRSRPGVFEQAEGGTLFLDEITEMPTELQVKLLRVLETHAVTRVGAEIPRRVDVRVISATNRDPVECLRAGRFRTDLFYRLGGLRIDLPDLASRHGDVALLSRMFLDHLNEVSTRTKTLEQDAFVELERHAWPGNVRELKHVLERAHILADDRIGAEHIRFTSPTVPLDKPSSGAIVNADVGISIREMEKRLIQATLEHVNGNKPEAACVLGISLKTLYNRLNSY